MQLVPIGYEVHLVCPMEDPFGDDGWTDLTYLLADIATDDEQYLRLIQLWDDHGDAPNGNGPWSIAADQLNPEQVKRLRAEGWLEAKVLVFQVKNEGSTPDQVTSALVNKGATFNYLTYQAMLYVYSGPIEDICACGHNQC